MDHSFTPVRTRIRRDGWTAERQYAFIAALGATRCITAACRQVGMSPRSAYALRARADAGGFAAAWDAALALTSPVAPVGRALNGIARPVFYRGKVIGERRRYDNRLAMFLLARRWPDRFGGGHSDWLDDAEDPDDPVGEAILAAPYGEDRELPPAATPSKSRDAPRTRR